MKEKNYFCWLSQRVKNTRGATYAQHTRNLCAMLLAFILGIGQMWAAESVTVDLAIAKDSDPSPSIGEIIGTNYSKGNFDGNGYKIGSDNNSIGWNIASSGKTFTSVSFEGYINTKNTEKNWGFKFSTDGGTTWGAELTQANDGTKSYHSINVTVAIPEGANAIQIIRKAGTSTYVKSITLTLAPDAGGDPVCPGTLTITSKDSKTAFLEGDAIELTAALSEGNGAITYQWYKGSVAPANAISGATKAKYQVASCTPADEGSYYCVASKTSCADAVSSAFAITVEADTKCFNMPAITSKPADLASVTVTGGTLSDVSTAKAVAMNANGLKLDGNYVYLKVTLADASIIAGTKITVAWKGAGSGAGIAVVNGDLAEKVIDETGVEAAGSVTHTFTAAEAANYADVFIIHRNASGTGIYVNAITVEDCGPAVTKHTVTLNYNDGETPAGSLTVVDGNAAVKPADPTRGKYTFLGWFVGETDDEYVWSTAVTDDITLKAHWQDPWTITFDADGGSEVADVTVKHNTKAEKPDDPTKDDYDFMGWFYGSPAIAFDWDANVTQDYALVAHWESAVAKYDVEYYDGETKIGTEEQVWATAHPTAAGIETAKPLYTFVGWFTSSALEGDPVALNTVTPVEGLKLYGKWAKAFATSVDLEGLVEASGTGADWQKYLSDHGYAFSTSNVSLDEKKDPSENKPYDNWPYQGLKAKEIGAYVEGRIAADKLVIIKLGHMAAAANVSLDGVAAGTATGLDADEPAGQLNYFYVENESVLRYETTNGGACVLKAITITNPFHVTFNANGGEPVASQYGHPAVTLPDASNGTKSLLGWFDAAEGGNKIGDVGESYTPAADIELFAQWEDVSTDARLASITLDPSTGVWEPAFNPEIVNYTYTMPYGTAAVPQITGATAVNAGGSYSIVSQASAWDETAVIRGVAASSDTKAYNITMKIAPKDGVCLIKGNVGDNTFVIDEEASLLSGTPSKNSVKSESSTYETLTGWKFNSRPAHLGLTLSEGTFQAGDVVEVFVTDVANGGGGTHKMRVFDADEATPAHVLAESTADMVQGVNRLVLPATSTSSLYLHRGAKDADYENWNPYVAYFAVYRAMNPVLTAITIDDRDGEIDALNDKHFSVTIPYESDLAALTVVPTIVWNAAAATNSIVVNSGSAWTLGDNTYVLTDKDGDATTYTITLTRDVLKHTVSFNTHGGSAVASVEVEHNAYLAAAPADPTKEDYIFQYWSLSDGGAEVDVTTVQIDEDKTFHAVWAAETGVIKLLDGEGNVNTTDFITGVTAGTVNFDDEDHNCASFGSTGGDIIGKDGAGKFIVYNSKTTQTKIKFVLYNTNSSPKQITLQKLVEGADDTEDVVIDVPSQERFETPYYTFNNTANRTMYAWTNSTSVKVLQVKVVDDGTPVKQAGEVGYSLNLNLGRVFAPANMEVEYDGLAFEASSNYKVLNSTELQTKKNISFTVASPVTLVLESTGAKYQVSTDAAGSGDEYAAGTNEHDLTAGTWHIVPTTTSNMKFTNIAFTAPKCEKPAIVDMSDVDLCENDSYTALTVSASVSDGGTLHYAWFKEAGATDEAVGTDAASFTPNADGEYYVIVTNQKDGFADNTETSNVVTVQHLAGTTITTAPVSVRKDAGEAATLTVVAAGKNLAYEWFTCNADGTGAVAVDPAATEASLDVIVPDGEQYYKVVVTGDCGTVEAIAKVEKWVKLTQQDVTENTVWDWANAGENIKLTSETTPKKNEEYLMANIRVNGVSPTNDATFNSQALLFYGENVRAVDGGRAYASIGHISFTTTVPGVVVVEFSNNKKTSDNQPRRVSINGKQSETSLGTNDVKTFLAVVPEGEVVITGVNEAGTSSDQYIRISKITFTKVDYTRPVTAGRYGTICLPNGGKIYGATLYEVAYYGATSQKIFFDEILSGELVAGTPYIFQPNSGEDLLAVAYTDNTGAYAGAANGLIGFIGASENAETQVPADGTCYILQNNQYRQVLAGADARIKSNRAYIKLTAINPSEPALAPGRRRISMGVQSEQVATGIGDVQGDEVQSSKVLINGQLFILRGEKMYDATGRLVK